MDQARRAENKLGLAEHLADASARLGVSSFALALLLAGAEPEELATAVTLAAAYCYVQVSLQGAHS